MKILIICSKAFYEDAKPIISKLEEMGHQIYTPNCFSNPEAEEIARSFGRHDHMMFKQAMYQKSIETINAVDAVLVINLTKNNTYGYIGGATFLEIYEAYKHQKSICILNNYRENTILADEIDGFGVIVLHNDLSVLDIKK